MRLRDIDVDRAQIIIRSGKGDKDRIVMLPASLRQRLIEQAAAVEFVFPGLWHFLHFLANADHDATRLTLSSPGTPKISRAGCGP